LDRNLADAHATIGWAKCVLGRAEETDAQINEAFRLSPRDTNAYRWMALAAFAKLLLGYDDEAAALLRRAIETNRNLPRSHMWLGAALANLGRTEEARAAIKAGLSLDPTFTIMRVFAAGDNPIYVAQRQRIVEGMRKAGLPEG
jgi:tetratricopeptide (TPR) repeat protein